MHTHRTQCSRMLLEHCLQIGARVVVCGCANHDVIITSRVVLAVVVRESKANTDPPPTHTRMRTTISPPITTPPPSPLPTPPLSPRRTPTTPTTFHPHPSCRVVICAPPHHPLSGAAALVYPHHPTTTILDSNELLCWLLRVHFSDQGATSGWRR